MNNKLSNQKHSVEIQKNLELWRSKPVLRKIYRRCYGFITEYLQDNNPGKIVEIGSGTGNLKTVIPDSISTDIFSNPWIDQVENAYQLSFSDNSVSNLVLFDVWHHLEFSGNVLQEFHRVLVSGGRVIIFEPALSLLGFIIYGLFHKEPISFTKKINWWAPKNFSLKNMPYYAAQGNATRIFRSNKFNELSSGWEVVAVKRIAMISHVASGGYSGPQLYPDFLYPFMILIDRLCSLLPVLFATRLLIVIEKK